MTNHYLTEVEACVIECAMELTQCEIGSKYGPMQHQITKARDSLRGACADLASENEGTWRNPYS